MLLASGEPLPLVMFEAPCQMRSRAIAALDQAAIPWRVVFTSPSLSGMPYRDYAVAESQLGCPGAAAAA